MTLRSVTGIISAEVTRRSTRLTCPAGVDTVALSAAARAKKVAYVPGRPFYLDDAGVGANQIRLAYSRVADDLIDEGIRRIADVVKSAL